jgi:putative peptidoglycan lipid II flippase
MEISSMKENHSNKEIIRHATSIGFITFLSRIIGVVREQVLAYYLGTGIGADAYSIAFMIPNLFRRLVGEGSMTASFIPVFSDYIDKKKDELKDFINSFFTVLTFFLTILTLLFIIFSPYLVKYVFAPGFKDVPGKLELTSLLTQLMFGYVIFISLAALVQAVLNSYKIFAISAFTPVLFNLVSVFCALIFARKFSNPTYAFALGVIIGGILQLFIQFPAMLKLGIKLKFKFNFAHEGTRKVLKLMIPGTFGMGIYQINVTISQSLASSLEEGSVSSLRFSARLMELSLGIFVISISTVILPLLSRQVVQKKFNELKETLLFAIRLMGFITIPSMVGLIILSREIVGTLFLYGAFNEHSLVMTSSALIFHSLGLFFIGASRIYAPCFYSMKDTMTPTLASFFSMIVNIVGCFVLPPFLSNGGIALSNTISSVMQLGILFIYLPKKIGHLNYMPILRSFAKILISSFVLGVICYALKNYINVLSNPSFASRFINLCVIIILSLIAYVITNLILKSQELTEFKGIFTRKN